MPLIFWERTFTAQKTVLVYPKAESATDTGYNYDWVVLRVALEKTGDRGSFELKPSGQYMPQARCRFAQIITGEEP